LTGGYDNVVRIIKGMSGIIEGDALSKPLPGRTDFNADLSPVDPSYLLLVLDDPLARRIHNLDPISRNLLQAMVTAYRGDVSKAVVNFFGDVWPEHVAGIPSEIMSQMQQLIVSSEEDQEPDIPIVAFIVQEDNNLDVLIHQLGQLGVPEAELQNLQVGSIINLPTECVKGLQQLQ
jgi:hypothetical protein